MPRLLRSCPKCQKPLLCLEGADARRALCPHCQTLLLISSDGTPDARLAALAAPLAPAGAGGDGVPVSPASLPPVPPSDLSGNPLGIMTVLLLCVTALGGAMGVAWVLRSTAGSGSMRPGHSAALVTPQANAAPATTLAEREHRGQHKEPGNDANEQGEKSSQRSTRPVQPTTAAMSRQPASSPRVEPPIPSSLASAVDKVRHSVATVHADEGSGSGFIVGRRALMATNYHVVAGTLRARATRANDDEAAAVDIVVTGFVACDPKADLVLLSLEKDWPGEPLLMAGAKPRLGDDVFAIGTPRGLAETVTRGIVSQIRAAADVGQGNLAPGTKVIQTDAFITNGNSGGPLCDAKGRVIGINTFGVDEDKNVNFAISFEELARLMQKAEGRVRPLTELPRISK